MANLATRAGVEGRLLRVHTPLIGLSKAEIVKLGRRLGVDYRIVELLRSDAGRALRTACVYPQGEGVQGGGGGRPSEAVKLS